MTKNNRPRFLVCSRGCHFDINQHYHRHIQAGQRCPNILSYDLATGTTYCRRVIKVDEDKEQEK
jgi:hypothetical protein